MKGDNVYAAGYAHAMQDVAKRHDRTAEIYRDKAFEHDIGPDAACSYVTAALQEELYARLARIAPIKNHPEDSRHE